MTPSDLYNRYKDEAKKYASDYGLDMTPREDGEWDAFRHAYASAVMTSEFSSLIANLAGLAVEFGGLLHGNSTASSNMDLWNNNIGRDIGTQTTSKDEIAQKVFDALKNGSLIVDLNDTRNYINDVVFDTSLDRFLFLEGADLSEEDLEAILEKLSNPKPIQISISDATANEKEGFITFTAKINQPLDCDFTFNVTTIDGSATGNVDYMSVPNAPVTIKKGETETKYSIAIASDGIYEISEEFMLYAHYEKGTYTGYDLGKVTGGTGVGTITDDPVGGCPVTVQPDFGLNFTVPSPVVSASGGGSTYYYSGGGGGSGGGYYTPSVYTGTSTPAPVVLPNVPVYECHYDVKLFSVALVSLPVACQPSTPPLVFDLNKDGITSLSMAASLALFDYNADDIKEHTAWIQNGDALLVRDTNNDGLINNGSELFGNYSLKRDGTTATDGYDALRDYDTNNDGIIDANDEHFNELKLWRDNGDGITQTTELKTLTEEGITSITLPNTIPTPTTENGNTITNTSTYTQANGTSGTLKDVWFAYENIATETFFDTDGDGFSEKMESWMGANQGVLVWDKNKDGKINSGKEILGTNMLLPNGKTANDSFSALNAFDTNHDGIIDTKDTAGLAIWKDTNKNGQTDAGELLQIGGENSLTSINLNPFQNMLSGYDRNHDMKINSSDAIYNYMYEQNNADGTISLFLPNNADAKAMLGSYTGGESIQTSQGVKTIKEVIFYDGELPLNNTINGTAQNDKLIGNRRSNVLYGNDGRDILDAKEGNDTLEGGRGDDYLLGGAGDDTYVFKKGDGVDLIEDSGGTDTLKFGEGISKNDLVFRSIGKDLTIGFKEEGVAFHQLHDRVILKDWYQTSSIDALQFSDGSTMSSTDILHSINAEGDTLHGDANADYAMKFDGVDDAIVIPSSNGLNVTTALSLSATFSYSGMGSGNQSSSQGMIVSKHYTHYERAYDLRILSDGKLSFYTYDSNNGVHFVSSKTLLKTDEMYDVAGTYDKTTGMAKLYINGVLDNEVNVGSFNIMQVAEPVVIGAYCENNNGSYLRAYLNGVVSDVQIHNKALTQEEVITQTNGNLVSSGLVAHYDFNGNAVTDKSGNNNNGKIVGSPVIEVLGDCNDVIVGSTGNDTIYGLTGNDTIEGAAGDDTIVLGKGNDVATDVLGNDTYIFNRGDGKDKILDSNGNDVLSFGAGITMDDLLIKQKGDDLIVALKQNGIGFDSLSDKITISNWFNASNCVENILFANGQLIDTNTIIGLCENYVENTKALHFNGGLDQLSTTQIVTSAKTGDQVSVSFEMNWDGFVRTPGVMPIGFYCYDLYFYKNMFGFNTGSSDIYGIADTSFLIGSTHTITAIFTQGDVHLNKLYIDGVEQTLTQLLNTPNNSMADITKEFNIGQWDINTGNYGFNGTVDNVQVHNRTLTATEITLIAKKEVIVDGLVAHYDFEGSVPYSDKSGNGHTAVASGNLSIITIDSTTTTSSDVSPQSPAEPSYDNSSYKNITIDNEILVDNTKTLSEAGLSELVLQTGYTGVGTSGTTAQTTTQGTGYNGTLQNNWFKSNALDTKYVFEGVVSADIQALPNIKGQGAIRDMQHVMAENPTLTQSVSAYKAQTATASFSDLDSQMNDILAQWVQLDNYGGISQATPPIVLDLNGNGITSTSLEGSDAYFDYDSNGRRELTAWSEKDDALLVVDRNNDGVINNGSELFGTYSKLADGSNASDGYAALSAYDSNNDKVIDANDAKFNDLRLWQDANQNGKSEAGELKTLTEMGVVSLGLNGSTTTSTENGNTISGETTFSTASGTTGVMRDVWFNYSDKHTIAVSDLSDADEKKLAIVESFLGKKLTASDRANPYVITAAFEQYNTLKYDAMAKMFSNELFGKNFTACRFMYEALNNTLARIINGDSNETEMALAANLAAAALKRNSTNALAELNHAYLESDVISNLLVQRDVVINLSDGSAISGNIGSNYYGTQNGETLDYSAQKDGVVVEAKGGNDVILGSQGRDILYGGSGNDIIRGNGGVDIISGRQGNDLLIGGSEQSVYEYYLGDGDDIILDQGGKNDILRFAYLKPSDLKIVKKGDDMIIYVKSPDGNFDDPFGSITIKNGYTTGKIEQFYFDSKILSFDDLTVQTISDTSYAYNKGDSKLVIEDTGGNDKIVFGEGITFDNIVTQQVGNDLIIALKFEERPFAELPDQLTIKNFFNEQNRIESFIFQNGMILNHETILSVFQNTAQDTIIFGDAQDNVLVGTDGNNIFNAGAGNDTMEGKGGNDNYIFGKGSGKDTILDSSGIDTLSLGLGITREDILTKVLGDDIILGIKETGKDFDELSDTVTIKNWAQTGFEIEKIVFDNGTTLTLNDLRNQAPTLTDAQVSITLQDLRQSTGTITVTDPDGDVLNYVIKIAPSHGALSVDDKGTWVYKANDGYVGSDSVLISIDDGNGGVVEQTLNFTLAVSAPSMTTNSLSLLEDTPLSNLLDVNNPVGGTLTYEIVNATKHGDFTLNTDGSYSYNPSLNYNGVDSVTLKVTNEYGLSTTQTIDLNVASVNDAPTLKNAQIDTTLQDVRESTGTIAASDPEGDTLTYSIATQAEHGTLSVDENGVWVYKAQEGYMGEDSAVVLVDDGNGGTVEQSLNFNVKVSNPLIETVTLTLLEDTQITELLAINNPIGGALTYEILDTSDYGSFSVDEEGHVSYTPSLNYNGEESVTIKVTNAYGLSSTQTISLNITPVNDAPTLNNDESMYTLNNIRMMSDQIVASDIDNDTLSYSISTQAKHGTLSIDENGVWVYKADGSYNGEDSAVILVDDGNGGVVEQTLHFNIQGYIYEGEDLVIDESSSDNTLVMNTVAKDNLSFARNGNDLVITVSDTNTITLTNYFTNPDAGIEKLVTSNGEITLTRENINEAMYGGYLVLDANDHLVIGNDASNWLIGNTGNDILLGASGSDYISGGNGNDFLIGGDGNDNLQGNSGDDIIYGDNGNDQIYAGDGNDTLIGGNGADILFGENGDDTISGGEGNDTIYAGSGNDTIKGGIGDDCINSSYGSDTYLFNIGDGNDTIVDTSAYGNSDMDKIIFGEGITKENLQILRDSYDLVFKVNDNDSVRIKYWFSGTQNTLEQVTFSDGTTLGTSDINALAMTQGTSNSDWLFCIDALGDNIYGMGGNDRIYSYGGDDFLSGGIGNDFLEGGSGSDTYFFNQGDGNDTINEWASWNSSDVDEIKFAEGITQEDVSFILSGTNLLIQYGQSDTIKVANTYNASSSPIERMELSDGSYITNDDISRIIQEMNAYVADKGMGTITNDIIRNNTDLMQIVSSGWHNA